MKNQIFKFLLILGVFLVTMPSYAQLFGGNKQSHTASYYNYKTECLVDKLDGSYIFRAWGTGSTKKEAMDQAKRNVLNDVLFNGVSKGSCRINPLIIEVNAKEKYKTYVYKFFNKDYKDYIKIEKSPKSRKKSRQQTVYGVKVRVDIEGMRQKLITDNIL